MRPYADHANHDLLWSIPLTARTVLDVGCGTGALGRDYKRLNPRARVLGIERDPDSARIAGQRLDAVVLADVEAYPRPLPELADGTVDCLIYGDVLEHLREPWAVLQAQVPLLSPHGLVLLCMPNIGHWSFADRLLRGTWDYEEQGLFDRTHLRWATGDMMRRALEAAGLQPHDSSPRIFDFPAAEAFTRAIEPALRRLEISPAAYLGRAAPLQFLWRAGHQLPERISILSTRLAPVGGVSEVRVTEPLRALASDSAVLTAIVALDDVPAALPGVPSILVLHRPRLLGAEGIGAMRGLLARGHVVVCEFDDHPDYIPSLMGQDVVNFAAVHAVQTTTETLAAFLRGQNPEMAVFPNALAELPEPRNFSGADHITLFFGGLNREADWQPHVGALNDVAARAGDRLRFQIVNDAALFAALETPHKRFTPLCDYPTYQDLLGGCELSWMPLADTPFNRAKSDLKWLEASAHRVCALASPTVYAGSVENGRTGLLFDSPEALRDRLLRLVASPVAARQMADAARAQVAAERMLAYQVAARLDWYRDLWRRRVELHAALLRRVPAFVDLAVPG